MVLRRRVLRASPLHDSAQIFLIKWGAWNTEVGSVRNWYTNEHDNWVPLDGSRSKWWVWNSAVDIVGKGVVQIQTYLQRTSEGVFLCLVG